MDMSATFAKALLGGLEHGSPNYTQEQARHRITMKRALRVVECPFENEDTTEQLEALCHFCNIKVIYAEDSL